MKLEIMSMKLLDPIDAIKGNLFVDQNALALLITVTDWLRKSGMLVWNTHVAITRKHTLWREKLSEMFIYLVVGVAGAGRGGASVVAGDIGPAAASEEERRAVTGSSWRSQSLSTSGNLERKAR
jgi:hypothetical protein